MFTTDQARELLGYLQRVRATNGRPWWLADEGALDEPKRVLITEGFAGVPLKWDPEEGRWKTGGRVRNATMFAADLTPRRRLVLAGFALGQIVEESFVYGTIDPVHEALTALGELEVTPAEMLAWYTEGSLESTDDSLQNLLRRCLEVSYGVPSLVQSRS